MSVEDKDVRIKVGVLKRLLKEKISYQQELEDIVKKLEQYKSEGKDQYLVKKYEEMVKETGMMIPDAIKRLTTAYYNLKQCVPVDGNDENEIYKTGRTLLEEAVPHIPPDSET